jgi:hypothetical protein
VGNGLDPQPPGNPPINDGHGTSPGDPGNKRFGHHRFGATHKNTNQIGGSGQSSVIDWSGKDSKSGQHHEDGLQLSSSWVQPFVCDFETDNPNRDIEVKLSPEKGHGLGLSRGRKR